MIAVKKILSNRTISSFNFFGSVELATTKIMLNNTVLITNIDSGGHYSITYSRLPPWLMMRNKILKMYQFF